MDAIRDNKDTRGDYAADLDVLDDRHGAKRLADPLATDCA